MKHAGTVTCDNLIMTIHVLQLSCPLVLSDFYIFLRSTLKTYSPQYFKEHTSYTPHIHLVRIVTISQQTFRSTIPKTKHQHNDKVWSVAGPMVIILSLSYNTVCTRKSNKPMWETSNTHTGKNWFSTSIMPYNVCFAISGLWNCHR